MRVNKHARGILVLAIVLGFALRLRHLMNEDLSADEGVSWLIAEAPTLEKLFKLQHKLDPGKLPVYHIALRAWISVFGDSIRSMRMLSVLFGVLATGLTFIAMRELWRSFAVQDTEFPSAQQSGGLGETAGGYAALFYALNLQMILTDCTARMYSLLVVLELLQIIFLVRAVRTGNFLDYTGVALFSALMVATNFTSGLLLVTEVTWLLFILLCPSVRGGLSEYAVYRAGTAMAAGLFLIGPAVAIGGLRIADAIHKGVWNWIQPQPPWWPFSMLRSAVNDVRAFYILITLAFFGLLNSSRLVPSIAVFLAFWLLGPFVADTAVSYVLHPMQFFRYVLIALIGFLCLAGLGLATLKSAPVRWSSLAFVVLISLGTFFSWEKHRHVTVWGYAASIAARYVEPDSEIAVYPRYATAVVRYYLSKEHLKVVEEGDDCGTASILIIRMPNRFEPNLYPAEEREKVRTCFPRTLAILDKVEIWTR